MLVLGREVFPVVWLVRRQPRARRGPGRSRNRSAATYSYSSRPTEARPVLDQTYEHEIGLYRLHSHPTDSAHRWCAFHLWQATPRTNTAVEAVLGGGFVRCVLTDDTRLVRVELLGEVDIMEGTRRRRLVIRIETRSAHTHTRSDNVVAAVLQLLVGTPSPHPMIWWEACLET